MKSFPNLKTERSSELKHDRPAGLHTGVTGNSAARKFCSQRHNFPGNYAAQRQNFLGQARK